MSKAILILYVRSFEGHLKVYESKFQYEASKKKIYEMKVLDNPQNGVFLRSNFRLEVS